MQGKPAWLEQRAGYQKYEIPVTRLLSGQLNLGLHAVVGGK